MPDTFSIYLSNVKPGTIAMRGVKLSIAYMLVGVLISSLDAQISRPGILAWITVLGIFGALIGGLGGRVMDVLVATAGASVFFLVASSAEQSEFLTQADAVASGLLLGAIAGGMFRPWIQLSTKCVAIIGYLCRPLIRVFGPRV